VRFPRLRQRGFVPNVLVMLTSTGLAQLLTVCFSPVLSRLYGPGDFGLYGTFLSLSGVITAAVTLQFSEALMLPENDNRATGVFWAATWATVTITALTAICCIIFYPWLIANLGGLLWLLPVAALFAGMNQTLAAWCARRKLFTRSAAAQVARSVGANSVQMAAGAMTWGAGGLIAGGLAGDLLSGLGLGYLVSRQDGPLLRSAATKNHVISAVDEHKDFVLYSTPQNVLNAVSQGAPVILLIHYFGAAVGGLYAFGFRVLQLPMSLVLAPLRQVLFQRLSEVQSHHGDLRGLFVESTTMLLGLSILPASIGFLLAPWVFGIVFGSQWVEAGEYARWLLVWLVPGFCNLPAMLAGRILRQQRNLMLFDLFLLISRLGALVIGGLYLSALQTIVFFSLVGAVFNTFLILFIWVRLRNWTFPKEEPIKCNEGVLQ
jgi:O-antigen/teichoic acid export membrane protein